MGIAEEQRYETGLMLSLSSKGGWISGRHHESSHNKCMHQPERRTKPHRSHSSPCRGEQKGAWTNMWSPQDYLSSHAPAPRPVETTSRGWKNLLKREKKAVKFLKLRNNSQPEWRIAANSRGCREAIPWAWNDSRGSILIPGKDGKEDRLMHPLRTERGRRKCQSPWCGFLPPWPKDRVHAYSCSFKMVDRFDSGCGYS